MIRKTFAWLPLALFVFAPMAWGQDAKPTPAPKCASIPSKRYPPSPPAALAKQGRFAACVPGKQCVPADAKLAASLGRNFCAMNYYDTCRPGIVDKPTLSCQPELRGSETKGVKLSNCISRPSKISCPKEGDEICLCDLEVEAKGAISCGCSAQPAPTATPVK